VSYPLLYSREKTLLVHAAADYDNNSSMVLGEQLYSDRLRSLLLGGNYEFADSWHGVNNNKLDIEHGFNILGAGNGGSRSRPEGRSDFTKVNFNISRLQLLGPRFSVLVAAQSQYTNTPLLSSEEFVFGGPDFGRGYDPAEITGDKGVAGKMELRFNTQPDLRLLRTVQYYVFYDAGKTWNLDRVAAVPVASAVSAGLGARFNFNKYLSGDCFIAKPLTRPVAAMVAAGEDGNGPRTFFQLRTVF
jgi:hemolysin activation/secretion protein